MDAERIEAESAGSFTGDDADNAFTAPQVGAAGTLVGRGGNDTLIAGDRTGDVVDGGAGDDAARGRLRRRPHRRRPRPRLALR